MTIDEAIKYLRELLEGLSEEMLSTYGASLMLGIEALKRVKELRRFDGISHQKPLLGETKD